MRVVLGLALAIVLSVPQASYAQSDDGTQATTDPSVEYQLALVQRGSYVAPDDPLVVAYANALDRVQPRCNETRLQLGNVAAKLAQTVEQESIYMATPLSLLRGLDNATPPDLFGPDHPANCTEMLGLVAYLASQGD